MGSLHKLYPDAKDSHDGDIFLSFKKIFDQREKEKDETRSSYGQATLAGKKELLDCLLTHGEYTLYTSDNQKILCTVLKFYGKDYVKNPYGKQYHLLLEQEWKWFGCNIEHRLAPYEESLIINWSSWMVNNQKIWRVIRWDDQEWEKQNKKDIWRKLSLA